MDTSLGIYLDRIEQPATDLGGRVGLAGVLDGLDRQAHRSLSGRLLGRAVHRAYFWDREDRADPSWWPQGISSSADAAADGTVDGRQLLVVSWYSPEPAAHGCRVTFLDLGTLRYRHVLVVQPDLTPLRIHAGGVVWCGRYLHLAATAKGFYTCDLDEILDSPEHGLVLPVHYAYRAGADEGHARLRHSFLSLDRASSPPVMLAGEYGRAGENTRLARYEIDLESGLLVAEDADRSWPLHLDARGLAQAQGAVIARGTHFVTVSHGPWGPGSVYAGRPGRFREHRLAVPMGPEDVCYWPGDDLLWSVTEHSRRRWIVSMKRSWFD